jgi:hypothetical protein
MEEGAEAIFTRWPQKLFINLTESRNSEGFDTADGDRAHRGTPFTDNPGCLIRLYATPLLGRAPRRRLAGANPQVVGRQDDLAEEREQYPNEGQHGSDKEQDNHGGEIHLE